MYGPRHSSPNVPGSDSPRPPNIGPIERVAKEGKSGPQMALNKGKSSGQLVLPWGSGALPQQTLSQSEPSKSTDNISHEHHSKHKSKGVPGDGRHEKKDKHRHEHKRTKSSTEGSTSGKGHRHRHHHGDRGHEGNRKHSHHGAILQDDREEEDDEMYRDPEYLREQEGHRSMDAEYEDYSSREGHRHKSRGSQEGHNRHKHKGHHKDGRSKSRHSEKHGHTQRGHSGAVLKEDRQDRPVLLEDGEMYESPVRIEEGERYESPPVLREDGEIYRSPGPLLLEDGELPDDSPRGAVLIEDDYREGDRGRSGDRGRYRSRERSVERFRSRDDQYRKEERLRELELLERERYLLSELEHLREKERKEREVREREIRERELRERELREREIYEKEMREKELHEMMREKEKRRYSREEKERLRDKRHTERFSDLDRRDSDWDARSVASSRDKDYGRERGTTSRSGAILIEDRGIGRTGAILKDDREVGRRAVRETEKVGRTGAVLLEDRDIGRGGAVLIEDRESPGAVLIEDRDIGRSGAVLIEDRESPGAILRDDRDMRRTSSTLRDDVKTGRSGAVLLEDIEDERVSSFSSGRGRGGAVLIEDWDSDQGSNRGHQRSNRSHVKDRVPSEIRISEKKPGLNRGLDRGPQIERQRADRERSVSSRGVKRSRSQSSQRERDSTKRDDQDTKRSKKWTPKEEDIRLQNCVRSGTPPIPENMGDNSFTQPVAAWVRCSAADLYFTRDPQTGNMVTTQRMRDLEDKFDLDLVQRAAKVKVKQKPYVMKRNSKPNWKHAHKCVGNHKGADCSSSDSDSDSDNESDHEEDHVQEELKFKMENPYRMHPEIWYNEPNELNDGPVCKCSLKAQKFGIRHNIYPGEEPIPMCDPNSNNLDKLHHYKITVSPTTNFLTKHPTVIMFDGHEYIFEGFSLFTHSEIPKLPDCQVIRFNIIYTIHMVQEPVPENFSVRSLDLITTYIFDEILELMDIDWTGHKTADKQCRRFHLMPRFARPFPENGKELLSMNDILLYLVKISKPLVDKKDLNGLLELPKTEWDKFVDSFRHVVVTCPGKRPSSIRIDQLDREECMQGVKMKMNYPEIVHHGVRPAQLSYAGDPVYKKTHRAYMKFRHIICTRAKVTIKDKEKLDEFEVELEKIRSKYTMKREVTSGISSKGFLITGIRADICQHAMLLPVLFGHIRFHNCLDVLEARIGYKFQDKTLLQLALTHSSYKINYGTNLDHGRNSLSNCGFRQLQFGDSAIHIQHTRKRGLNVLLRIMARFGRKEEVRSDIPHNERLEYLGDAVVEFIASTHLYNMLPQASEGELTIYRGSLVQNAHLAVLADKLRLQDYLLYAHGTDLCHNSTLKHAMANCYEALMGALFLDSGIELADRVFSETLFDGEPDLLDIWINTPKHPLIQDEPDGDRHWIKRSDVLQSLLKFEEDIGYEFKYIRLLARSLTMRHVGYNNLTLGHNQRMEFLGDSIMQLIASDYLYKHFPDHHEGHLTLLRSSLVSNRTQATVADEIGMPTYLVKAHVRQKDQADMVDRQPDLKLKEKADLLESLLGAMYVDSGLEPCKIMCNVCFFPRLQTFILNQDWNDPKSHLQQCCLTMRALEDESPDIPVYKVLHKSGPTNIRRYKVGVYFRDKRLAVGEGGSIQQAEMAAAENALNTSGLINKNVMSVRAARAMRNAEKPS